MRLNPLFLLVFGLLGAGKIYAGPPVNVKQFINQKDWNFVENKGQLADHDVSYYGRQGGVYLYCKPGTISFVFTKVKKENSDKISEATGEPSGFPLLKKSLSRELGRAGGFDPTKHQPALSTITTSRADLVLINSNPDAQILATDQQAYYENYYTTGNANHGITNVHTFKTITYKDIYPHIDMVLHAAPASTKATAGKADMKYEFVVHPGGKVSDIQMRWNGLENLQMLKNGGIKYAVALGEMSEGKPVSFQGGRCIKSKFLKKDGSVKFEIDRYNGNSDLVIDPDLIWATYFGGSQDDQGQALTTDPNGNVYLFGNTYSDSGIATSAAYLTTLPYHGEDCFIAKFNEKGQLAWATYYGNGAESAYGIASGQNSNIILTGTTESQTGIATSGAFQTSYNSNGRAAFLADFNTSGKLEWATYYGGNGFDVGNTVCCDASGNIYFAGELMEQGMATSGAYQTSFSGTTSSFIAKFNSAGVEQWFTYLGGGNDEAFGVVTDSKNNLYVTGITSDSDIATIGAYQTSYKGGIDAYIAKFTSSGGLSWATYYGGTNTEQASGIAIDPLGNVFVTGYTYSDNNIATSGAYQTWFPSSMPYSLVSYLAKFDQSGNIKWSTYFGNYSAQAFGICIDKKGNIYITGQFSGAAISTTDAYQTSYVGATDAFLAQFSNSGGLLYATGFGGSQYEYDNAISTDMSGNIYIAGDEYSSGIATSGAYQTSYASSSNNLSDVYLAKFNFYHQNDAGILSINPVSKIQCSGKNVFKVNLENSGLRELSKVQIILSVNNKIEDTLAWNGNLASDSSVIVSTNSYYLNAGYDTIRAWVYNPNGVMDSTPQNDTLSITDYANPSPSSIGLTNFNICEGNSVKIGSSAIAGHLYLWSSSPTGFNSKASDIIVSPTQTTTYYFDETIAATSCSSIDTVIVNLIPNPIIKISFLPTCPTDSTPFSDTSSSANIWSWSFGDGDTSNLQNPKHLYASNGMYNVGLKVANSAGCTDSTSQKITISNCVWPGDANDDKTVDMKDFLTIGQAYGDTGLPRPSAILLWTGQPCPHWIDTLPGGINEKYADCNGDSIVDYGDTIAIVQNYSLTHSKSAALNQGSPSDPGFTITPLMDSVSIGQTFQASISLGSQSKPVQNLYGTTFSILADPALFETDKAALKIVPSFLGTDSIDLMGMEIDNTSNGTIDLGLCRIDHKNVTGFGPVAILSIPVKASISQKYIKTVLAISNNSQISYNGKNVPLYFSSDSFVVQQHSSGINPSISNVIYGIQIYPNPFSESTTVQYALLKPSKVSVVLLDITGKQIGILENKNLQPSNYSLNINTEKQHLAPGIYMLKFVTDDGIVSRKMVKF